MKIMIEWRLKQLLGSTQDNAYRLTILSFSCFNPKIHWCPINFIDQQSDDGGGSKSRSFFTSSRPSSAAASLCIAFSGVVLPSVVPFVRGVRLLPPLDNEFGPLGVPGDPDFFWSNELKKLARTPSPAGVSGGSFASIWKNTTFRNGCYRPTLSQLTRFFGDPWPATGVRGVDFPIGGVLRGETDLGCCPPWPCCSSCCCLARNTCSSSVTTSTSRLETVLREGGWAMMSL